MKTRNRFINASISDDIKVAEQQTKTNPTDAEKQTGTYAKGVVNVQGFDITIENPAGSVRSGKDKTGKSWSTTMAATYGYFGNAPKAKDGDQVDVFIGPSPESDVVFIIDQIDPGTGNFDEHKVMFGFYNIDDAKAGYLANYDPSWLGLGAITKMSMAEFKTWLHDTQKTKIPVAYVKPENYAYETLANASSQMVNESKSLTRGDKLKLSSSAWTAAQALKHITDSALGSIARKYKEDTIYIMQSYDGSNVRVKTPDDDIISLNESRFIKIGKFMNESKVPSILADKKTAMFDLTSIKAGYVIPLQTYPNGSTSMSYMSVDSIKNPRNAKIIEYKCSDPKLDIDKKVGDTIDLLKFFGVPALQFTSDYAENHSWVRESKTTTYIAVKGLNSDGKKFIAIGDEATYNGKYITITKGAFKGKEIDLDPEEFKEYFGEDYVNESSHKYSTVFSNKKSARRRYVNETKTGKINNDILTVLKSEGLQPSKDFTLKNDYIVTKSFDAATDIVDVLAGTYSATIKEVSDEWIVYVNESMSHSQMLSAINALRSSRTLDPEAIYNACIDIINKLKNEKAPNSVIAEVSSMTGPDIYDIKTVQRLLQLASQYLTTKSFNAVVKYIYDLQFVVDNAQITIGDRININFRGLTNGTIVGTYTDITTAINEWRSELPLDVAVNATFYTKQFATIKNIIVVRFSNFVMFFDAAKAIPEFVTESLDATGQPVIKKLAPSLDAAIVFKDLLQAESAQAINTIPTSFDYPMSIVLDNDGNKPIDYATQFVAIKLRNSIVTKKSATSDEIIYVVKLDEGMPENAEVIAYIAESDPLVVNRLTTAKLSYAKIARFIHQHFVNAYAAYVMESAELAFQTMTIEEATALVNDAITSPEVASANIVLLKSKNSVLYANNGRNFFDEHLALASASGNVVAYFKGDAQAFPFDIVAFANADNYTAYIDTVVKSHPLSSVMDAYVLESNITTDQQFMDYATNILKEAHGDKYDSAIATKMVNDLLQKYSGNYGTMIGVLQSSLGV